MVRYHSGILPLQLVCLGHRRYEIDLQNLDDLLDLLAKKDHIVQVPFLWKWLC